MSTSPARIRANQKNAARSTGPKTAEGKERSRANSYKHGLTGDGVVLPEGEAAEVGRRFEAYVEELKPVGVLGLDLVRRAATMSVRMGRCVDHESAAISGRVRRAIAEFVAPEGVDAAEADGLRAEAGKLAAFDPSDEATLARRYEAAAERSFFRALKELRLIEREAKAGDSGMFEETLGSFMRLEKETAELEALYPEPALPTPRTPFPPSYLEDYEKRDDVPFTIGRRR
jgi:hypothetical protein